MDSRQYVTKSTLKKDYGFSDAWVGRIGDPDKTVPNPHYKSGPPMQLWTRDRVLQFIDEHPEEYERRLEERDRRQKISTEAMAAKRRETVEWSKTVPVVLEAFPKNLQNAAMEYFNFPDRAVNDAGIRAMLRHAYSNYHDLLLQLFKRVGRGDAYQILKDRVNAAIDAEFPQTRLKRPPRMDDTPRTDRREG